MKKIGLIFGLILFLFLYSNIFPQIDTSDYFPLKTGNFWEYWGIENWSSTWIMMTIESIGDTTMSNGKTYQILKEITYPDTLHHSESYAFLRAIDKKIYFYYEYDSCALSEYLLYDFEKADSTIWPVCLEYPLNYRGIENTSFYYISSLNIFLEGKVFDWVEVNGIDTSWAPMGSPYVDFIGKGIGIINRFIWDYCSFNLSGAKINNHIYGTLSSIYDKKMLPMDFIFRKTTQTHFPPKADPPLAETQAQK